MLLEAGGLCKRFAAPVLCDFELALAPGEVHALVGANGAGKSTLARILCGLLAPDAGTIVLGGRRHAPRDKPAAEAAGVVMVMQELHVIGTLSVAENLFLDRLPAWRGWVRRSELAARARAALDRVGLRAVDPSMPAGRLGVGEQQLVEIAAALARTCRLLILDEPTAALTDPEIAGLFENIRRLQRDGVGVLYISHRMDEIRRIADRVTVMRDGRRIAVHSAADVSPAQLIREMSGHELPPRAASEGAKAGGPALRVADLRAGKRVRGVSLTVRRGEVVGLAGLVGAGRTETLRAIVGADRARAGSVRVGDGRPRRFRRPAEAVAAGLGLVPEDRQRDGLLLPQPVRVNATLATLAHHARRGWIGRRAEAAAAAAVCDRLAVQRASIEQPVAELSGGNQQKVVLARWLARDCAVLLCDEPTRGVDAAAKDAIHALLRALAGTGKGVLVVSSELPELMALCDRIVVLSLGRVTGEFRAGEWTQEGINAAAFGGHHAGGAT